jgi:hypothetical protein
MVTIRMLEKILRLIAFLPDHLSVFWLNMVEKLILHEHRSGAPSLCDVSDHVVRSGFQGMH